MNRSFFAITGLRLRVWPIVVAAIVMQILLVPARWVAQQIFVHGPASWASHVGMYVFVAIVLQALCGLFGIAVLRRVLPRADAHLRWPAGPSLVGASIAIGVAMGLVMFVADYWPDMRDGTPPRDYPLDPGIAAGWLLAMITTGLAEETIFRGLLVGMLAVLVPGRVRAGGFEIPVAGVLVAALFGLAHYGSFFTAPLAMAIAQQVYAFVWGLVYVWLMERSDSLLAPIVAHGLGNFVEVALALVWLAASGPTG